MRIKDVFNRYEESAPLLPFPFIIAEAGVNHESNMDLAKRLIDEAKEGGAHAVKFQTYKAETIASKNSPAYWDTSKESTETQYKLFKKYDKFWKKEFEELKRYCNAANIEFLSTPFDFESARFLNDLVDAIKISSSDITNRPFIEYICGFKKPVILSTGASDLDEISEAVAWIDRFEIPLALLHCILNYPTLDKDANLGMILDLKNKFPKKIIGYSDHTLPGKMKTLEIASLFGCAIIEKHFTYDKTLPGNDHYHAMDKEDLKYFINLIKNNRKIIGTFEKKSLSSEKNSRRYARRSIVAARKIPKGAALSAEDITFKRPGTGISPKYIKDVIGKTAVLQIDADEILKNNMLK